MNQRRGRDKPPKRPPESYLGKSEEARDHQLANLRPAPPAPPGNQLARTHGGYASRVDPDRADAQVARLVELLAQDPPLRDPEGALPREDRLLVELLARCLVRLGDVSHFLTMRGVLGEDGNPRPAVALEGELRREAAALAVQFGLSPVSRARLGLDVAEAGRLITSGPPRPGPFEAFSTDPDVRSAGRELVRAAARARDRELNVLEGSDVIDADADAGEGPATEGSRP